MELRGKAIPPGTGHEAGRALLAQMYLEHTGSPMPPICLTPMGKPYFLDSSLHFSISHTPKHVFCVLSDKPVGLDAEEADRRINPDLARRILSEKEFSQFQEATDKHLALLKFWVLKEAAAKLSGKGISYPPNQTDFSLDDPRIFMMDGCIIAVMEEETHAV